VHVLGEQVADMFVDSLAFAKLAEITCMEQLLTAKQTIWEAAIVVCQPRFLGFLNGSNRMKLQYVPGDVMEN
jgi:hypothetical protein